MLIAALAAAIVATLAAQPVAVAAHRRIAPRPLAGAGDRAGRLGVDAAGAAGGRARCRPSITWASRGRCRCRPRRWKAGWSTVQSSTRKAGSTSTMASGAVGRASHDRLQRLLADAGFAGQRSTRWSAMRAPPARATQGAPWTLRAAEIAAVAPDRATRIARSRLRHRAAGGRPLNVNTAPPEVLAAAFARPRRGSAGRARGRARAQAVRVGRRIPRPPTGASAPDDAWLGVRSDYFLVTVRARQGESLAQGRALLRRTRTRAARGLADDRVIRTLLRRAGALPLHLHP